MYFLISERIYTQLLQFIPNKEDPATQTNWDLSMHLWLPYQSYHCDLNWVIRRFIAAITSCNAHNRLTALAGAMLALGPMTCLSGECFFLYEFTAFKRKHDRPEGPPSAERTCARQRLNH